MIYILMLGVVAVVVMIVAKGFHKSSPLFKSSSLPTEEKENPVLKKQPEEEGSGQVAEVMSEEKLPAGLSRELLPKHVAVIADGNRRWAKGKGMPTILGHGAAVRSIITLADLCCQWGIKVLTIYAFSSENWGRPRIEVDFLLGVAGQKLLEEPLEHFMRKGIKVSVIGDLKKLPDSLQKWITKTTETTKNNSRLNLILAINYGGRADIVQACQIISRKVIDKLINVEDIDENIFRQELKTNCTEFPYPDLLIRTSGEQRISNFLMWELAYSELYFDESLWPDFGEKEFVKALLSFQGRQRRFGVQH